MSRKKDKLVTRNSLRQIRGHYWYTEDNLLVYNISASLSSKKADKNSLIKHFAKFGTIKKFKYEYGKTRSKPIKCSVCYKSPLSAKKALKKSTHTVNRSIVAVTACPSWEQPLPADFYFRTKTNPTAESISLLSLNDYCLEVIFNDLDLKDQVRLSLSHERFQGVFERMICPRKINTFNFNMIEGFTMWEVRQLLKTAGPFIRSLEITRSPDCVPMTDEGKIYNFIREFCTNLKRLQVVRRRFIPSSLLDMIDTSRLTEFELFACEVSDYNLKSLSRLRNLKSLGLANNGKLKGSSLYCFKKVEKLSLYGCTNLYEEYLIKACKALPLRYLDLRGIASFSNWCAILEHCVDLETLKMKRNCCSGLDGVDSIARLPKLKRLEMEFSLRAMPSSFYDTLVDNHAEDLEELKITGYVYALFPTIACSIGRLKRLRVLWIGDNEYNSSEGFLKAIQPLVNLEELNINHSVRTKGDHILPLLNHCTRLKTLNLRCCIKITNDFIFNAIKILENRATMPAATPLEVQVFGTGVNWNIMEDLRYINAKHLLRISFYVEGCEKGYLEEKSECLLMSNTDNENSQYLQFVLHDGTESDLDLISLNSLDDDSADEILYIMR